MNIDQAQLREAVKGLTSSVRAAGLEPATVAHEIEKALDGVRGATAQHALWVHRGTARLYGRAALAAEYRDRGEKRTASEIQRQGGPGRLVVVVDFGRGPSVAASTPDRLRLMAKLVLEASASTGDEL